MVNVNIILVHAWQQFEDAVLISHDLLAISKANRMICNKMFLVSKIQTFGGRFAVSYSSRNMIDEHCRIT